MNNVFLNILPTLDLHGNTRDMIKVLIDEFISDNIKLAKKKMVIVHGKGEWILKNETHQILSKDKRVLSFYQDPSNVGCTVVELKEDVC